MIGHQPVARNTLIAALSICADDRVRARARRFLMGLSCDELAFIAEFLGACIVECSENTATATEAVELCECRRAEPGPQQMDRENKIILLREFLDRSHVSLTGAA